MKTLAEWFKAHLSKLKLIFLISVIIIVIFELSNIVKNISFSRLSTIFSTISPWNILFMALIGLVSVIPMIGYDFTLNNILGQKPKNFMFLKQVGW